MKINTTTSPELRKQQIKELKAYYKALSDRFAEWSKGCYRPPSPLGIEYPNICKGMKCEAKTRNGHPCKNDGTSFSNGRCKFHGGMSSGPITQEGKKISAGNGRKKTSKKANPVER